MTKEKFQIGQIFMKKKLASSGEMSRYESAAYPFLWESTSKERKKPKSPINNGAKARLFRFLSLMLTY